MNGTILVSGADGQVGQALGEAHCAHEVIALGRARFDIADPGSIADIFAETDPALVINAAAYTQVDRAEHESGRAFAVNRDGVANLALVCREAGIPMLHLSTDYVFDGRKRGAYGEDDPVSPLGVYGKSKAEGEAVLRRILERHVVLRTSWVFSPVGANFVRTMLRLGRERDELAVVDDQHGCPTSAASIAGALLEIAGRHLRGDGISWGTYHFRNRPETTWHGFAREIFARAPGYDNIAVRPISTREYPSPAPRPANSVLDCGKLETEFGIDPPDWRDELDRVLAALSNTW